MIKVNLLKDQTARSRKAPARSELSRIGIPCAAIFLLAAGAMSIWSYCVQRQVAAAMEKRDRLRTREAHLQKLDKEIEHCRKIRLLHQSGIDLIEQLKKRQADPVLLLNAVIQGIPRKKPIRLTSLTEKSGSVRITGFSRQTQAIPELMNNLAVSGIFGSIDLEEIESLEEASRFTLLCTKTKNTGVERSNGPQ
jgi:Tfp pilus assembly protein PilN